MPMDSHLKIKGKIVLVPFPFDDLSSIKMRPAVCLTNTISPYKHVVLAFITSQIPDEELESDVVIKDTENDFAMTGLRVSSTIRLHRLITVTTTIYKTSTWRINSSNTNRIRS